LPVDFSIDQVGKQFPDILAYDIFLWHPNQFSLSVIDVGAAPGAIEHPKPITDALHDTFPVFRSWLLLQPSRF
jgi:hypothetical protein